MDRLSKLPLECLQIILHIFDKANDLSTLAALLRTNKYISSATLPFLYHDPFRHDFHSIRKRQMGVEKDNPSGKMLTYMLLNRLPVEILPVATSLMLENIKLINTTTMVDSKKGSSLDYLAHIRHLDMKLWYTELDCRQGKLRHAPLSPAQLEYTTSNEFKELYSARPFTAKYSNNGKPMSEYLRFYYHTLLHHEVPWILGLPILEQLQSLTILRIYSIKQYINVVHRLPNLEKVVFTLWEYFEDEFHNDGDNEGEEMDQMENEILEDVILFLQEHVRLFPGRLKYVECFEHTRRHWINKRFASHLNQEIARIVPPLTKVTHLGEDNWVRFIAKSSEANLLDVHTIKDREMSQYDAN
ncbi:hypothetical protein FBU30_009338 [Linnemannia zychae]|nr:hypothetical protein FBU30_009338 [Linnemannia zychae]